MTPAAERKARRRNLPVSAGFEMFYLLAGQQPILWCQHDALVVGQLFAWAGIVNAGEVNQTYLSNVQLAEFLFSLWIQVVVESIN